jgi:hypothetical protein
MRPAASAPIIYSAIAHILRIMIHKGKVHPVTCDEGTEGEQICKSTLSLTSALGGCGWLTPRPGRFNRGMIRYPLYMRLGGLQGRSGQVQKISTPPEFDHRTVQRVASCYTDCAIPGLKIMKFIIRKVWAGYFSQYIY